MSDFAAARSNMVDGQLRPNRVSDPAVLAAILELPRERFVPAGLKGVAYVDGDIPLGEGRHLMAPLDLGRLLQAAQIASGDVALNIGAASGYDAAVLGALASTVVAVESDPALAEGATATLAELGIGNVAVVRGKLANGYPEQAPYDVIFFSGAVPEVPVRILDQLAEGGRLVAVIDREPGVGSATLFVRLEGVISHRVFCDASPPLLPELAPAPKFVF